MIHLQVHMHVKPEARQDFAEKAKALITSTQAEAGNISYALYEDVSSPGRFVMIEEWKDEQAIEQHNQTEHLTGFFAYARDVLTEPVNIHRF
ncbi:putative quinol monooxygenase [Paenibacillus lemnae]|uniref:Antibiotic biosynthesis monooxygenase n=1 Tax=Paenibacillus lemnae TaxID=1330551 RepID=A0A848M252_PAELE|nr:putative quinol monooxygenase [Paenibacillus lemnae]NMO94349.1 antibiotic biosynthesis monooxygenase [Paenibacillus lemnae]